MNENVFDVAIIGGGLAGLTLAIQCAENGYSVILFEKEQYPFHKVCGEYISLESKPFLEKLGVQLNDLNLPIIEHLQVSDSSGKAFNFDLPQGGFGISRFSLDNVLYQIAVRKGVNVMTSNKVNEVNFIEDWFYIDTTSGQFKSKVAAGSFGKRSNIDVKLNRNFINRKPGKLENFIGVKYHIKFPQPDATISLHNFSDGYCGISQIEDDKCCLCYLTTAANLKSSNNSIEEMEKTILHKNPRLKHIFSTAEFLYKQPLVISQVSFNKKSQVENHMLMVGDAAGLITPLCGNGMSMAMHAGKLANDSIRKFLSGIISRTEMENRYTRQWNNEFASRLRIGRVVQKLFGGDKTTSIFLRAMSSWPRLAGTIIKSTHGKPF